MTRTRASQKTGAGIRVAVRRKDVLAIDRERNHQASVSEVLCRGQVAHSHRMESVEPSHGGSSTALHSAF